MSPRTTRSLVLGLIGSAAILTLFWSCQEEEDKQQAQAADGTTHSSTTHTSSGYRHSYYRSRPWFWGWGSSYRPSYGGSTFVGSSGHSSGSSRVGGTTSSSTSRGGFGGSSSAGHSSGS
ncbi:MAG: hypothetical protein K1X57_05605 [Gemmataceae bacterium]|nr:hypothetical protein [Gemmataceae bacterium]